MSDQAEFLKSIISVSGLSGYETPVRQLIAARWQDLADEIGISKLGSLQALKRGSGSEPRPAILLAAHMDAIGMMVTRIVDGYLHVAEIGAIDARVLPGQPVVVHGREALPGTIVMPPKWLLPPDNKSGPVRLENLLIDTGLPEKKVRELVRLGDLVSFGSEPATLGKKYLAGHSLDNRASVAALTRCLEALQTSLHVWDVWAVATVQEEETLGGAATSAFDLRPKLAVAVDVTFGAGPGSPPEKTFGLGKGPVLGWGPNIHPGVHNAFKKSAERLEMNTQMEVLPAHSGTDAYALQVASEGIPTMVIYIPLRYMHTPVEVVHLKDIERTGRLLAEFIAGLAEDFMETISWDDI
jgi:endoglucanase